MGDIAEFLIVWKLTVCSTMIWEHIRLLQISTPSASKFSGRILSTGETKMRETESWKSRSLSATFMKFSPAQISTKWRRESSLTHCAIFVISGVLSSTLRQFSGTVGDSRFSHLLTLVLRCFCCVFYFIFFFQPILFGLLRGAWGLITLRCNSKFRGSAWTTCVKFCTVQATRTSIIL